MCRKITNMSSKCNVKISRMKSGTESQNYAWFLCLTMIFMLPSAVFNREDSSLLGAAIRTALIKRRSLDVKGRTRLLQ